MLASFDSPTLLSLFFSKSLHFFYLLFLHLPQGLIPCPLSSLYFRATLLLKALPFHFIKNEVLPCSLLL